MEKHQLILMAKDTLNKLKSYSEDTHESILYKDDVQNLLEPKGKFINTNIIIKNIDCVDSTRNLKNCCLLNFASAHNPGGGWLSGAQAQEESIARRTTLLNSIDGNEYYKINNEENSKFYSDVMIYSPYVKIIKDSNGKDLKNNKIISVITAPAVNLSKFHIINDKDRNEIRNIMLTRIRKIISIAIINNKTDIVLGAWGCGVFKQNPLDIANYFKQVLINEGQEVYFENIVFAVYKSKSNLNAFINAFK